MFEHQRTRWGALLVFILLLGLIGRVGIRYKLETPPPGIEPIASLDAKRYVGQWFEIIRIDSELELDAGQSILNVSRVEKQVAKLTLSDSKRQLRWEGDASFASDNGPATLLIPCFGPFECGYHLVSVDEAHGAWMIVTGHDFDQLWVFSRTPGLPSKTVKAIQERIEEMGFDSASLLVNNFLPEAPKAGEVGKGNLPIPGELTPGTSTIINPETPANEPPVPIYLPEIPSVNPAVPKNIPALPRNLPVPRQGD